MAVTIHSGDNLSTEAVKTEAELAADRKTPLGPGRLPGAKKKLKPGRVPMKGEALPGKKNWVPERLPGPRFINVRTHAPMMSGGRR